MVVTTLAGVATLGASVLTSWLWQQLAEAAANKDISNAKKLAFEDAVSVAFKEFVEAHPQATNAFFDEHFLTENLGPELHKLLMGTGSPDYEAIQLAYEQQFRDKPHTDVREYAEALFQILLQRCGEKSELRDVILSRRMEETHRQVSVLKEDTKRHHEIASEKLDKVLAGQSQSEETITQIDETLRINNEAHIANQQAIAHILENQQNDSDIANLLSVQLDRIRDDIRVGRIESAISSLESLYASITKADRYLQFRWHTNMGACMLIHGSFKEAARHFKLSHEFNPSDEKSLSNLVHSHIVNDEPAKALELCLAAQDIFPRSGRLMALRLNAKCALGEDVNTIDLPTWAANDSNVLFTLAHISAQNGDYEQAYLYAHKSYQTDRTSLESKRMLLATTMSWLTNDSVSSYYEMFDSKQIEALRYVVNEFEPIEDELERQESSNLRLELISNLSAAMLILNMETRANSIIVRGLQRFPTDENLIRLRARELERKEDFEGIEQLVNSTMFDMSPSLLLLFCGIAANAGKNQLFDKLVNQLQSKGATITEREEAEAMQLHCLWMTDDQEAALELAKKVIKQPEASAILRAIASKILALMGELEDAKTSALACCKELSDKSRPDLKLQTADSLFECGLFSEAAEIYKAFANPLGDNYPSYRYIASLINADHRESARIAIEKLPGEARLKTSFLRLESILARRTGNWLRLLEISQSELQKSQGDSALALGYIASLHRLNRKRELREYLEQDPIYEPLVVENEIEISKYLSHLDLNQQAVDRLLRLFAHHPSDTSVAGYYMLAILQSEGKLSIENRDLVAANTAVEVLSGGNRRWLVLYDLEAQAASPWPELVRKNSDLWTILVGLKNDDIVDLSAIGYGFEDSKVINIVSIHRFVINKAQELIASSTDRSGPVWTESLKDEEGGLDSTVLVSALAERKEYLNRCFQIYSDRQLPISKLSEITGVDLVTLFLDWPYEEYSLKVSLGSSEARSKVLKDLQNQDIPIVLDLTALIELQRLKILPNVLLSLGNPFVPETVREKLLNLVQLASFPEPVGSIGEQDGNLVSSEHTTYQHKQRKAFLDDLLAAVTNHCTIVPTHGRGELDSDKSRMSELLDVSAWDSVLLSIEKDALLVSEDAGLQAIAEIVSGRYSASVQNIFPLLRQNSTLSVEDCCRYTLDKISANHRFVSVCSDDLLWGVSRSFPILDKETTVAIESFEELGLDIETGIRVSANFLKSLAENFDARLVRKYYDLCEGALLRNPQSDNDQVQQSLSASVLAAIQQKSKKELKPFIAEFSGRLVEPKRQSVFKVRPLTAAIQRVNQSTR